MQDYVKFPVYAKGALILIGLIAAVYCLQSLQDIILPLIYALLLAILVNPAVNYLISKRLNRVVSIFIIVIVAVLFLGGVGYLIFAQFLRMSDSYSDLSEKFTAASDLLVKSASQHLTIKEKTIYSWFSTSSSEYISNFALGENLFIAGKVLITVTLLPVYMIMILYYKPLLLEFIRKLFRVEHHVTVIDVLTKTKRIIQTYLTGLFFELIIVAIMNSTGLLLLGIKYAILIGVLGSVLNIIPYIGGIIAVLVPMTVAFVTEDNQLLPLYILLLYVLTQFIDNNFIVPKIVASSVQINALVSIIVVLLGSALWGVAGMFLSIPLTAIVKIICDHIEPLKPLGYLLGNIVPARSKFQFLS
jgi:predicted PurR-regulated permease PerM